MSARSTTNLSHACHTPAAREHLRPTRRARPPCSMHYCKQGPVQARPSASKAQCKQSKASSEQAKVQAPACAQPALCQRSSQPTRQYDLLSIGRHPRPSEEARWPFGVEMHGWYAPPPDASCNYPPSHCFDYLPHLLQVLLSHLPSLPATRACLVVGARLEKLTCPSLCSLVCSSACLLLVPSLCQAAVSTARSRKHAHTRLPHPRKEARLRGESVRSGREERGRRA